MHYKEIIDNQVLRRSTLMEILNKKVSEEKTKELDINDGIMNFWKLKKYLKVALTNSEIPLITLSLSYIKILKLAGLDLEEFIANIEFIIKEELIDYQQIYNSYFEVISSNRKDASRLSRQKVSFHVLDDYHAIYKKKQIKPSEVICTCSNFHVCLGDSKNRHPFSDVVYQKSISKLMNLVGESYDKNKNRINYLSIKSLSIKDVLVKKQCNAISELPYFILRTQYSSTYFNKSSLKRICTLINLNLKQLGKSIVFNIIPRETEEIRKNKESINIFEKNNDKYGFVPTDVQITPTESHLNPVNIIKEPLSVKLLKKRSRVIELNCKTEIFNETNHSEMIESKENFESKVTDNWVPYPNTNETANYTLPPKPRIAVKQKKEELKPDYGTLPLLVDEKSSLKEELLFKNAPVLEIDDDNLKTNDNNNIIVIRNDISNKFYYMQLISLFILIVTLIFYIKLDFWTSWSNINLEIKH